MIRTLAIMLCAWVLAGCATEAKYSRIVDSWVGRHSDSLVRKWGAPHSVYELQGGAKILLYDSRHHGVISTPVNVRQMPGYMIGSAYVPGPTLVTGGQTFAINHWCKTEFETDSNGIIRRWKWEGNDCRAK